MNKPLVIFGCGDIAELAHFYFTHDANIKVEAFTVDEKYLVSDTFCQLPVVAFETLAQHYPPESFDLFIALSYTKLNQLRKEKYLAAKAAHYSLVSYISSKATVWDEVVIGDNCFILEDNTIQPFVHIGNNVTLWSGNHIGHHSTLRDHTFLASHAVISGGVEIGEACFIGVNATIRDHIHIGDRCVIGAGALLLDHAEADGVYSGAASQRSKVPGYKLKHL